MVLGSTLRELVVDLGGAKDVKLVQLGSTGRIVPAANLDTPMSFEAGLGAGAVTVYNQSRDVVDIVHRTEEFLADESCGKCFPCREGTRNIAEIMARFAENRGEKKDIKLLEDLSKAMTLASSCGLGQAAPIPLLDGLQHFRSEFERRIKAG
jgi:NADH:ubiquinone oxidoreductase subunit F (NADH-binding)